MQYAAQHSRILDTIKGDKKLAAGRVSRLVTINGRCWGLTQMASAFIGECSLDEANESTLRKTLSKDIRSNG